MKQKTNKVLRNTICFDTYILIEFNNITIGYFILIHYSVLIVTLSLSVLQNSVTTSDLLSLFHLLFKPGMHPEMLFELVWSTELLPGTVFPWASQPAVDHVLLFLPPIVKTEWTEITLAGNQFIQLLMNHYHVSLQAVLVTRAKTADNTGELLANLF